MIINKIPIFESGSILTKEVLESLRNYPINYLNINYLSYSDGIIDGLDMEVEEQTIFVKKGIIKFNEEILFFNDFEIYVPEDDGDYNIKLQISNKFKDKGFNQFNVEVILDDFSEVGEDEFELGRFKLREGAFLYTRENKFDDFNIEFNLLNLTATKYSSRGSNNPMLKPSIVKLFAKEALKKINLEAYDFVFINSALNHQLSTDGIVSYINYKLNLDMEYCDVESIYHYLLKVMKMLGKDANRRNNNIKKRNLIMVE